MIIHSSWKPKGRSEFVTDTEGRQYEIATFEGGRTALDPALPPTPWKAVTFGRKVRASVFLKGGPVQFTVDTVAQLPQLNGASDAVRREARRRVSEGDWEPGRAYDLVHDSYSPTV